MRGRHTGRVPAGLLTCAPYGSTNVPPLSSARISVVNCENARATLLILQWPIGATYAFDDFAQALLDMDARRTHGKSVVRVR